MKTRTQGFVVSLLVVLGIALILGYFFIITLDLIASLILYLLATRTLDWFERQGLSEQQANLTLALIVVVACLTFFLWGWPIVGYGLTTFTDQIPLLLDRIDLEVSTLALQYPVIESLLLRLEESLYNFGVQIMEHAGLLLTSLLTIPILALVMLASRKTLRESLYTLIPNDSFELTVSIGAKIVGHIEDYLVAKTAEMLGLIIVFVVGLTVIGFPLSLVFGIIAGILNIIPIVGLVLTIPVLGLGALLGSGVGMFAASMGVLLVARLVDDTVLQAWIVAKLVDLHPVVAVVVTFIGGEVLGMVGLLFAIPIFVISKLIVVGLYDYWVAIERHQQLLQE